MQMFIDYLHAQNPCKLKFFDGCGLKLPFTGNAANIETGRPVLEVGDFVVRDNCPTHHFAGGEVLQERLGDHNVELVYTPTYSLKKLRYVVWTIATDV